MTDIFGNEVSIGCTVAVAGQVGQRTVMRGGKVLDIFPAKVYYKSQPQVWNVRVEWTSGNNLPSKPSIIGLDKVAVVLAPPAPVV